MSHLLVLCEDELGQYVLENFLDMYRKRRFKSIDVLSYKSNTRLRTNFAADVTQQLTDEPDSSVLCLVDRNYSGWFLGITSSFVNSCA